MDEPVRLVQTNLRETDAGLDPARLVAQVAEFPANALLFNCGGIVAFYPTRVPFHYPSPHLPPGLDLFGDVLREAHRRGIRVIGRFDLSKTPKAVYDAHPEWFFKKSDGAPVVYNDLYSTCINGGYYRGHALKILAEALEHYDVDGLFFNMFGNQRSDYSGNYVGLCRCESCRKLFEARFGRPVPEKPDADYERFMFDSSREVAARIAGLIRARRPRAAFLTYIHEHVDGIMSESNTAVERPLPLWHGAGPAFNMHGTPDQEDRQALAAARPVFAWHAAHQDLYVGQESAARVLLLSAGARQNEYRGLVRVLSERHIPFAAAANTRELERRPQDFDLVIVPDGTQAPEAYLKNGGRVLATGATGPGLAGLPPVVRRWPTARAAYWRVRDNALFPSLRDTNVMFVDGEYAEFDGASALTMIPPARFGPPEKVWTDKVESEKPGLLLADYGKGRLAYLPWNAGALYYRHSSTAHAALLADLVDHLLPAGRQLKTDAHPLVEIVVMRQPARGRTLVHFVNLSGHSQTAYFAPVRMRDIQVELAGEFRRAQSARSGQELPVARAGRYGKFTVPVLEAYDAVILQ
jgi:hypothetical protein